MVLWHNEEDTTRSPYMVHAGEPVAIWVGTHPIEHGQYVRLEWHITNRDGGRTEGGAEAHWHFNDYGRGNSYWLATFGPFTAGDTVEYVIVGQSKDGEIFSRKHEFVVEESKTYAEQ